MQTESNLIDLMPHLTDRARLPDQGSPPPGGSGSGIMLGRGLTDADMQRLESHFQNPETESQLRDRALFLMLSRTALRVSEIIALRFSAAITLPDGKIAFPVRRKRGRTVPTIPGKSALDALKDYHNLSGITSDAFFMTLPNRARRMTRRPLDIRSLQRIVARWGKELNIQTGCNRRNNRTGEKTRTLHPHAFRHTSLQKLFDERGAEAARKLGGHTTTRTVERFYTTEYFDGSEILNWGQEKD